MLLCLAAPATAWAADSPPAPKIAAVMEFELIDDMRDYKTFSPQRRKDRKEMRK